MPKTGLHAITGAATGAAAYALDRLARNEPVNNDRLWSVALAGGLAGALPDILEPPLHRRHRRFFHSRVTLAAAALFLVMLDSGESLDDEQKAAVRALVLAYLSHLLMDSTTPMGLPFIL